MQLRDAQNLKQSILENYYRDIIGKAPGLRTESAPPVERTERRMAVGMARVGEGYRVEIRIQRQGGAAHRLTEELQRKHGKDIHVEILQKLEIPPLTAIKRLLSAQKGRPKKVPRSAQRLRPVEMGLSVGHIDGGPGTLGALVEMNRAGGDAILSNAHVLAPTTGARRKDPAYQPGREGRPLTDDDRVGVLRNFIQLSKTGANTIDAAIALLDEDVEHDGNRVPDSYDCACAGKKIAGIQSAIEIPRGSTLAKVGRSTGYTEGTLSAASMDDVTVLYHGSGNLRFDNLIEVTWEDLRHPFTQPGDSGSLVFDPKTMKAVGLHFAGGEIKRDGKRIGVSYACDIGAVLDSMDCGLIL